jgi:DNA-directed RNA polymerase subunit RPC12/RpoP
MSVKIKITCAKCKKPLWATAALAGKRVKCPACQSVLTVPAPPAADLEALAAKALGAQPAEEPAKAAVKDITFACPSCDEEIKAGGDMAGKQMPCPHCSRIIKVPLPVKTTPKDWRTVDPRAGALLRRDAEAPPEGEWGTGTSARPVSQQALEEAEIIPVAAVRVPWRERLQLITLLGMAGLGCLILLFAGFHAWTRANEQQSLNHVRRYAPDDNKDSTLPSLAAAEIYRAKGEYYGREGKAPEANKALGKALAHLAAAGAGSAERDLLLVDVGRTLIGLGGDGEQVSQRKKVAWEELANPLRRTAEAIDSPEGRSEAVRVLGRDLGARRQTALAETVAQTVKVGFPKDRTEMRALIGLALVASGQSSRAEAIAQDLARPYEPRLKDEKLSGPLPGPRFLALLIAVGRGEQAERLAGTTFKEATQKEPYPEVRLGFAQGLAQRGEWDLARQVANAPGLAALQLEALVGVAEIAAEKDQRDEAAKSVAALGVVTKQLRSEPDRPISSWVLWRLARACARAGVPAEKLEPVLDAISNSELRERAQLALAQARPAPTSRSEADKELDEAAQKPEPGLVLEFLARRDAHVGGVAKKIERWESPILRAYGYAGLLLSE